MGLGIPKPIKCPLLRAYQSKHMLKIVQGLFAEEVVWCSQARYRTTRSWLLSEVTSGLLKMSGSWLEWVVDLYHAYTEKGTCSHGLSYPTEESDVWAVWRRVGSRFGQADISP